MRTPQRRCFRSTPVASGSFCSTRTCTVAEKPRLYELSGLYRLLMQEEAIHATAWLWPDGAGATTAARKTGRRPRFLRAAITRFGKKVKLHRIASHRIASHRTCTARHQTQSQSICANPPARPSAFNFVTTGTSRRATNRSWGRRGRSKPQLRRWKDERIQLKFNPATFWCSSPT